MNQAVIFMTSKTVYKPLSKCVVIKIPCKIYYFFKSPNQGTPALPGLDTPECNLIKHTRDVTVFR